jgi:hypothetical protein
MANWSITLSSFSAASAFLAGKNSKDTVGCFFFHISVTFMGLTPENHIF